ncbi:ribosomal-protein-alanine N-acetyltransferase [Natranaerovirga pectinivora]|uniref:Ribosomal-protein-alanine N-acetyltransferase n=1 Tax=Natranaerovirga pectinivora TaxID=682400 RepID=A0A4R3MF24_9FIRM|nr:GNAT family protein [Natranaerovirga pectinivora]TCT11663.1 ribosomal-protein-alanine N-acetyltransferase [Natranaerovirga pectinivora]
MIKEYMTNRLILKTLDESHTKKVIDYYYRNKEFLEAWEPNKPPYFYDIGYQKNILTMEFNEIAARKMLRLWIFKKEDPKKIIGTLSFNNIIGGFLQCCQLGYKLDTTEVNKGYMTEAITKGIEIMFSEYNLHRIEAYIMPQNEPSIQVIHKLNFIKEGLARKYIKINGNWEDHICYSLIKEDL